MSAIYTFPTQWKQMCAALLRAYKERRREELGYKRLGWGRIRDEIMVEFDQYAGNVVVSRDERLKRQHLEAMDKGAILSDPIFAFVDAFIRRLDIQDTNNNMVKEVRESLDFYAMREMSRLYQSNSQAVDPSELKRPFNQFRRGKYFHSDSIEQTWFRSIVVRFDRASDPVAKITVAYLPEKIQDITEAHHRDVVFLAGFLIPFTARRWMAFRGEPEDAVQVDQFLIKLTRAEYKGDRFLGYADGELLTTGMSDTTGHLGLLDFPNAVLNPSTSASTQVNRYYPVDAEETASLERVRRESEPDYEDAQPDFFKTYRWKINLWNASKYREMLDIMFNNNYKGYIY